MPDFAIEFNSICISTYLKNIKDHPKGVKLNPFLVCLHMTPIIVIIIAMIMLKICVLQHKMEFVDFQNADQRYLFFPLQKGLWSQLFGRKVRRFPSVLIYLIAS